MTDPAKIAATLTVTEKERLTGWQGVAGAAYNVISTGLQKKGLLKADWTLSPLGLAVLEVILVEQGVIAKPEPAREFKVGDRVHRKGRSSWGLGTVLEIGKRATYSCSWEKISNTWTHPADLILAPDPTAETFFEPDYVTPVGQAVETDNPRAFPSAAIDDRYSGMTLRDWFAGQALIVIPRLKSSEGLDIYTAANAAYQIADAMLAERVKV